MALALELIGKLDPMWYTNYKCILLHPVSPAIGKEPHLKGDEKRLLNCEMGK